jgi:hypothetical protein
MSIRALFVVLSLAFAATPALAQKAVQNREWIAHCVSQLAETNRLRARTYCKCMARSVDTSEKLRQTELERSFPPLHRLCFRKAGFKRSN